MYLARSVSLGAMGINIDEIYSPGPQVLVVIHLFDGMLSGLSETLLPLSLRHEQSTALVHLEDPRFV